MHESSRMSFILTIVVSTTKNIAENKECRVSVKDLVIGSYTVPDQWGYAESLGRCSLILFSMRGEKKR